MDLPLNVDFSGKVVVITGAGGVLCSMMAKAYAQAGAKVAALDLNEEALQKLEGEIPEGQTLKGYKAMVPATSSSTGPAETTSGPPRTMSISTRPRPARPLSLT